MLNNMRRPINPRKEIVRQKCAPREILGAYLTAQRLDRTNLAAKEKDRRSGPHLFSFTLAMREAFIEFLQHFQRLLSSE